MVTMPPAEYGIPGYLATTVQAGTGKVVTIGLFSRARLGERLFYDGRQYTITAVEPYAL